MIKKTLLFLLLIGIIILLSFEINKSYKHYKAVVENESIKEKYTDEMYKLNKVGNTLNYVYIIRTDENYKPIKNTKWEITTTNNKKLYEFSTDKDGIGGVVGLEDGTYYMKEIKVPKGNKKQKWISKLIFNKIDNSYELNISDAPYTYDEIKINLKDDKNNPVPNKTYELYKKENNELIDEQTTNKDGIIIFTKLKRDYYYVVEKNVEDAEKHYARPTKSFIFNITYGE